MIIDVRISPIYLRSTEPEGSIKIGSPSSSFSAICLLLVAVGSAATIGGNPSSAIAGIDVFLGVILLYIAGRSLTKGVGTPLVRSFDPDAMTVAVAASTTGRAEEGAGGNRRE
jgi:hypothetical protein